jgi:hypothetical protein
MVSYSLCLIVSATSVIKRTLDQIAKDSAHILDASARGVDAGGAPICTVYWEPSLESDRMIQKQLAPVSLL